LEVAQCNFATLALDAIVKAANVSLLAAACTGA